MQVRAAAVLVVGLTAGCYEGIGTHARPMPEGETDPDAGATSSGSDDGETTGDPAGPRPQCEADAAVAEAPLRRLSRWELNNTIRDLLGDDTRPASRYVPGDLVLRGFDTLAAAQNVSAPIVDAYMRLAEDVVARIDPTDLVSCETYDATCVSYFVASLGHRAYRRPLSEAEEAALLEIHASGDDFDDGTRRVVEAVLQSPKFLYRPEWGLPETETDGVVALGDYELATRLSYFLWGSMPDDTLLRAASDGELTTDTGLTQHAERLLANDRAREAVAHFAWQWLGLPDLDHAVKDAALYPEFDDDLALAMRTETLAFVEHVVFDGAGNLSTVLTADYTLADASIARLYGIDDGRGDAFEHLALPPQRHAGVLAQPSLMTIYSDPQRPSPPRRGEFVWTQLRCAEHEFLEPPPDVDTTLPEDPDATTRERLEQHLVDDSCATCHRIIDPLGFAFEHYDAIGRWRDEDNGQPIDASGSLPALGDFDGAAELAALLSRDGEVKRCFADRMFTFAVGRAPDEDGEACTIDALRESFLDSDGGDVRALMLTIVRSDAFRYRPVAQ